MSSNDQDYIEFTELLKNGQEIADKTKRSYVFVWRGYKACISSQLPKLTTYEMKRRFNLAMDSIKKLREKEDDDVFFNPTQDRLKTPSNLTPVSSSSSAAQSSSSSSQASQDSITSEEPTQIPETQFVMEGKFNRWRLDHILHCEPIA